MNNLEDISSLNSFFKKKLKYDTLLNEIKQLKKKNKDEEDKNKYKRYTNKLNKLGTNIKFVINDDSFQLIDNNGDGDIIDSCTRSKKILINDRIKYLEDEQKKIKNDILMLKYNLLYEYETIEDYEQYNKYKDLDEYQEIVTNIIEDLEKKNENIDKIKSKVILQKNAEIDKLKKMYEDYKLSKSSIKNELLLINDNNISEKKDIMKSLFSIEKNIQDVLNTINMNKIKEVNFNNIQENTTKVK